MIDDEETRFKRRDYERLPVGFPAELIEGALVKKTPATIRHQQIVGALLSAIANRAGQDRVLLGPVDVFLDEENVYQPDLVAFVEPPTITPETKHIGIPDVVFEVLLPESAEIDRDVKCERYLAAGVAEVWLVDPRGRTVEIRTATASVSAKDGDMARSAVLEGFDLAVTDLLKR